MRSYTKKQTKIIVGNNAEDFEAKLNKSLALIGAEYGDYEVTFNTALGYCAYILYNKVEYQAEDVQEEYELVNEIHKCMECKYYKAPTDKRVKNTRCELSGKLSFAEKPCCLHFYESLETANTFLTGE